MISVTAFIGLLATFLLTPPASLAAASSGLPEYQLPLAYPVPGGWVHQGSGNLLLMRKDLDIDTRLGNRIVASTYDSADGSWRWSFQLRYDGRVFIDASGARFEVEGLRSGEAFPGSIWLYLDARRIATKGGLIHVFDSEGRLESVHWKSRDYPRLALHWEASRLSEVVQQPAPGVEEPLFEMRWDTAGRLQEVEDRAGRVARYAYDAAGRLETAIGPKVVRDGGPGTVYSYEGARLVGWRNDEGEETRFTYSEGRVVAVHRGGTLLAGFSYRSGNDGRKVSLRSDASGATTRLISDARGRLLEETDPTGARREWVWSGLRPSGSRDPTGRVTEYRYAEDDLVETIDPLGGSLRWVLAERGESRHAPHRRAVAEFYRDGERMEARSYDASGRLIGIENAVGDRSSFAYAPDGSLTSSTSPTGSTLRFSSYGPHGHPGVVAAGVAESTRVYDDVGNLQSGFATSHPLAPGTPGVVAARFDPARNVEALELVGLGPTGPSAPQTLRLQYRSDGRLNSIERPFGGNVDFVYDDRGWLVERRERASGRFRETRFEYDAVGRLSRESLPNGVESLWRYDPAGRLLAREWRGAGRTPQGFAFTYEEGELRRATDLYGKAGESYGYDGRGDLVSIGYEDGSALRLERNAFSRVERAEFLDPRAELLAALDLAYDPVGREIAVASGGRLLLERGFQQGRLVSVRYGNGLSRSLVYDDTGLLESDELRNASGFQLAHAQVHRSIRNFPVTSFQRLSLRVTRGRLNSYLGDMDFLVSPGKSAAGARLDRWHARRGDRVAVHYRFDALGNRSGEAWRFTDGTLREQALPRYNEEANRLLRSSEGVEYVYDPAGYAVRRGEKELTWTAAGQIESFGSEFRAEWDAWGRPVRHSTPGEDRFFRYGGALEFDEQGRPAAMDLGHLRLDLSEGPEQVAVTAYRHPDRRGHVIWASDSDGSLTHHTQYSPFGRVHRVGAAEAGPGFDGAWPAGPLLLTGARPYDPEVGRFLSPDPVLHPLNAYAYTTGNPIWFHDPDGDQARAAFATAVGASAVGFAGGVALAVAAPSAGAVAAGVGLASFSSGLIYGLGTTQADLAATASTAFGVGLLSLAPVGGTTGALFATAGGFAAGFGIGQDLRGAILGSYPSPAGLRAPAPFSRSGSPTKQLSLRVAPAQPVVAPSPGGAGCSPGDLRGLPTPTARIAWFLFLSAPAQFLLLRVAAKRRRRKSGRRNGHRESPGVEEPRR